MTLISDGNENTIVAISLLIPYKLLISFKILVTLKTLKILINYGAKLKLEFETFSNAKVIIISTIEADTINKSNLLIFI